ncbi:hypothetical protein [Haloplanus aerogenes]|uniref:Uncharacterized protein n=1 Tax=Haloplanus aerogenes TaxID=660522 RepID=A0A3M0DA25_9EURY|nr:hypothetical protein [Haloplanus aerogenes]AZH26295.1 hypothetical protein DU502_13390 [Haloplanus aerogenes]RMB18247.1 hypothetical protein ATH50_1697 [Haloplanus aerogenes]
MPSTDGHRPPDAVAIASRYRRLERPLSGAVALLVGVAAAVAMLSFPLLAALGVVAVVVLVVRAPLFTSQGTARLATEASPEAVRADFAGPTPPSLAFQWGVADAVRETESGATYEFSSLFGLRSTTMAVETHREAGGDVRLVVTAGGRPWATYEVTVTGGGEDTTVGLTWSSDRRFGLNRLPQWAIAERYRADALGAQGYTVVDREATLSLSG